MCRPSDSFLGEITNRLCQAGEREERIKAAVEPLLPEPPHSVNSQGPADARRRQTYGNGYVNNETRLHFA